ncbi:small ribosomal subunit Rsm22 family protein [Aquamicrobium sp. LC103]|uniref:small ribosomal subunit Rsm22 family protein n=1 Tax=Aquamicrobium sp. LC103 TaxID=1120658 RepID=UPI00063E8AF7|nr:small ribosomal subunit Rsm22 family protein [Aquamicrobium sp. LC103]TKT82624.1 methyltransferase type 11 [Aquamicrobium sp. LC103]
MELPAALRQAVEQALEGTPLPDLRRAADLLSRRYRAETRDGRLHVGDDLAARAYLATRLPATYAAVRRSLAEFAEMRPGFSPASLLDVGAGPGTAFWAVSDEWPDVESATLIEASGAMRKAGEGLAQAARAPISWRSLDVEGGLEDIDAAELVTLCYVLDELAPPVRDRLVDRLWSLTADTLVIVEPGTPAGWQRIIAARDRLLAAGAAIAAPCPHHAPCPLKAPDWCHFAQRVARSRLHRRAKGGEVPFEDEKFIYLAACRHPLESPHARVLASPRAASGAVRLKLCRGDGTSGDELFTRRQGAAFKTARRLGWGDAFHENPD